MSDNPQAFPCLDDSGCGLSMRDPGMTLRDWFAGQALAGLLANPLSSRENIHSASEWAFTTADAMLKERGK